MGAVYSHFAGPSRSTETRRLPYKYPPSEGAYFGPHFFLGNVKYPSPSPSNVFLFGDNSDLNYLSTHTVTFPYKPDKKLKAIKTLRSLINVQKDSMKIVKTDVEDSYNIEFVFDSDVDCCFRILYSLPDDIVLSMLTMESMGDGVCEAMSPPFPYKSGTAQAFSQPGHVLSGSKVSTERYDPLEGGRYPVAVVMETVDTTSSAHQILLTAATIDEVGNSNHNLKVFKQWLCVDGVVYMLQDIYGLENKHKETQPLSDDDNDDDDDGDVYEDALEEGSECIICFSEVRDTLILPCRHLSICTTCAANLRYKATNCPICRAPFHALVTLNALEEINNDDPDENCEVAGYRSLSLVQALNGYPVDQHRPTPSNVGDMEVVEALDDNITEEVELFSDPEEVEFPPIELPLSPTMNGYAAQVQLECTLPGTPSEPTSSRRVQEANEIVVQNINMLSDNEDGVEVITMGRWSPKTSSDTSSNVSAESHPFIKPSKGERNTTTNDDIELKVIHNKHATNKEDTAAAH